MHINLLRTSTRRGNAHTHEVNRVSLRLPAPQTPKLPTYPQVIHRPGIKRPGRPPAQTTQTPSETPVIVPFLSCPARAAGELLQGLLEFRRKKRGI